jgi:hypothetical protein
VAIQGQLRVSRLLLGLLLLPHLELQPLVGALLPNRQVARCSWSCSWHVGRGWQRVRRRRKLHRPHICCVDSRFFNNLLITPGR